MHRRLGLLIFLTMLIASTGTVAVRAEAPQRLLDAVGVDLATRYIDVVVIFSCPVRYVTHSPPEGGTALHVQLALSNECGGGRSESLPPPPDGDVIDAIHLEPLLAADVDVEIRWRREEHYLVVPTHDRLGVRIRLLRPGRAPEPGLVIINQPEGAAINGYAINLESSLQPFDAQRLEAAREVLGVNVYVSQIRLEDTLWYRLRAGPFSNRDVAARQLTMAQKRFPRAWLAIADEVAAPPTPADSAVADATSVSTDPPKQPDPEGDALYKSAQRALKARQYTTAIETLTKLLSRADHPQRADARELLGLTRERNGQLAHAQAEYETFMRDFPSASAFLRVRQRLTALRAAERAARFGGRAGTSVADDPHAWRIYGGGAQLYRRDQSRLTTNTTSADLTTQNALLSDMELIARKRGTRYDALGRVSAGYVRDLLPNGPGDQVRVTSAFFELADRERGWSARLGRQSRSSGGLLGSFDGLYGSYRFLSHLTLDIAGGFPIDSSATGFRSERRFTAATLDFGTFADRFEPSIYAVQQSVNGRVDRQAVGTEVRYLQPNHVLVGFIDYDFRFQVINSIVAIDTLQLPARWRLITNIEQRQSPVLATRNALIGQPLTTLDDLSRQFDEAQIEQLARDRSAKLTNYGLSLSRPLGERFQLNLNTATIGIGATPDSGGIAAMPALPRETNYAVQLLATSLFTSGDLNFLGLRWQTGGLAESTSLGLSNRFPIWLDLRLGPQLRVERRVITTDDSITWLYAPSLRLSLQKSKAYFEAEVGGEISSRKGTAANPITQDARRRYFSLGYRVAF